MSKSEADVVKEFNELVNMTAKELEAFLKTDASTSAGWSKGDSSGETIGHDSGRKIVDILKRNPNKDPSKYTDQDKQHMRKVVSYCKRHLAQEEHMKNEKSPEELAKTKSTLSLKNWGHDPLKTLKGGNKPASKSKPVSKKEESNEKAEKPKSAGKKDDKPASKSADKPASKAKAGDKREAEDRPGAEAKKPASKKAKTDKPVSEGKKGPSRAAKKA